MPIAHKVRNLVKSSGRSLREIAHEADITPSCLSRYMAGKAQLRADGFVRLLAALGVDFERDLERKIASNVDVQNPRDLDEALVFAYKALPSLEKRRLLRLLMRLLMANGRKGRHLDAVRKELLYASGSLELRQEA